MSTTKQLLDSYNTEYLALVAKFGNTKRRQLSKSPVFIRKINRLFPRGKKSNIILFL